MAWVFLGGSTVAVSIFGWLGRHGPALVFAGIVFVEVLVLAVNGWKCPLTPIAERYTADRRANFDIYLPEWLARYNKQIFGGLYVVGLLITWLRWTR